MILRVDLFVDNGNGGEGGKAITEALEFSTSPNIFSEK